jgi:hypothetical protein
LKELLLNLGVLIGILGLSAVITGWFARTMYIRCLACGTLNARRRTRCRSCERDLRQPSPGSDSQI